MTYKFKKDINTSLLLPPSTIRQKSDTEEASCISNTEKSWKSSQKVCWCYGGYDDDGEQTTHIDPRVLLVRSVEKERGLAQMRSPP